MPETHQKQNQVSRWKLVFSIVLLLIILYTLYKTLKAHQKLILIDPSYGFRLLDKTMSTVIDNFTG